MTRTNQALLVIAALITGTLLAQVLLDPLTSFVLPDGAKFGVQSISEQMDVMLRFAAPLAATFLAFAFAIIIFRRVRVMLIVAVAAAFAGAVTMWLIRMNIQEATAAASQFEGAIVSMLSYRELHLEIAPLAAFLTAACTVIVLKVRRPEIELENAEG